MNELITVKDNAIQIQQDFIEEYRAFQDYKAIMEIQEKELKKALLAVMEAHGIKSFECEGLRIVYKAPSKRKTIDTDALKAQGIYELFTKESEVKSSVSITLK